MSILEERVRLRAMVRGAYDLQKLRMMTGARLCAAFKAKLGAVAGESEEELEENAQKVLAVLRQSFIRLSDGVARNRTIPTREKFKGDEIISEYSEIVLMSQYLELEGVEKRQFSQLENSLCEFPIYTTWLRDVVGVGPAMAAVCIAEIDIHKAKYPSSLWRYAGLDVAADGVGRSRRKEHLVDTEYTNKDGEVLSKKSITYNPFLKTKLAGVLTGCFLRSKSPYAAIYNGYKHRLQNTPEKAEWTKMHIHNAAKRYMIKMFLLDLHREWRKVEGYPASVPYHEAKLGIRHAAE